MWRKGRMIEPEEIFMDSVNLPGHDRELYEGRIERPIGRAVFSFWTIVIVLGVGALGGRLWYLQGMRGALFAATAEKNISYTLYTASPRGTITDKNGELMAENSISFAFVLRKKELAALTDFSATLSRAAELTGKGVSEIWRENHRDNGSVAPENLFSPDVWPEEVVILPQASYDLLLQVATRPADFRGLAIEESLRRVYPLGSAASQLVGYIGQPSREDQTRDSDYRAAVSVIGKTATELVFEDALRGKPGKKIIEIDSHGTPQRERFIQKAASGDTIVLNIDAKLQETAYSVMERNIRALGKKAGALVLLDPRDGRVLALVSFPGFDPELIADGKDAEEIRSVLSDSRRPLFDRAISGVYSPGSTVKPILATGALEEGIIDPEHQIYDEGFISVPNPFNPDKPSIFKDWSKLGWVDMRRAIAMSANVYFYTIGGGYKDIPGLGIERIRKFYYAFGLGVPSGIELPGEKSGLVPGPEEKKITRPSDPMWRIGDTYISSIGQGDVGATPLQMAGATAAIANGGTLWRPFITKEIRDADGGVISVSSPEAVREHIARPESLRVVQEGMRQAVTDGSARFLNSLPFAVAGKTGTAQTGVVGKNHGWFIGFAPYDNPEIAIAVVVEEGTGGSTDAVPIAKEVLYQWFLEKQHALHPDENTGLTATSSGL